MESPVRLDPDPDWISIDDEEELMCTRVPKGPMMSGKH